MSLKQGHGGRLEVPSLEKEPGSDPGGLNFPFKGLTASLMLQEK